MRSVLYSVTTLEPENINTKSKTSRKKTLDHCLRKKMDDAFCINYY